MRSKKVFVISILAIIIFAGVFSAVVSLSPEREQNSAVSNMDLDYAAQLVFENKLLQICDYPIGESSISLTGHYYDGLRLYLCVASNRDVITNTNTDDFCLLSDDIIRCPDIVVTVEGVDEADNMMTKLLIFNMLTETNFDNIRLSFRSEDETDAFSVDEILADIVEKSVNYEEISLNKIIFGKTSTYFECNILARIEGASFQTVIGDTVVPVYLISKEDYHYKFLIPYLLDDSSTFVFISNNTHSVELRIPIDLSNAVE